MMKIVEINEKLSKFLEEESIESLVDEWLEDNSLEDFVDIGTIEESVNELAKSYGYQIYDKNLVKDVKGRPDLSPEVMEKISEKGEDVLMDVIEVFANQCSDIYNNFVICGKSGGYWGLSNVFDNIELTEAFKPHLIELIKENSEEQNYESWEWTLYNYLDDFQFNMIIQDNPDTIKFKDEYIKEMNNLQKDIDNEEKAMNSLEYWDE